MGLQEDIWYTGTGKFVVKDKLTKKVKVPDFKIHGKRKVIESAIQYYYRKDLKKYTKEVTELYNRNGYEVLVLDGNLPLEEQKIQLLKFVRNGLKIKKIKKLSNLTYYKNSKPFIREYETCNLHCFPHNNYLVRTTQSTQTIISHNCLFTSKDKKHNFCDTFYSSFKPEINQLEIEIVEKLIRNNIGNIQHLVITGGEPLLQTEALIELLEKIRDLNLIITIETNGTIYNEEIIPYVHLFSISPKLSNSTPSEDKLKDVNYYLSDVLIKQHEEERYDIQVLKKYFKAAELYNGPEIQFKFVITSPQDINEVVEKYLSLTDLKEVWCERFLMMPEGITEEELKEKSKWLIGECIKHSFRFCPRLHIDIYGSAKYV